MRTRYLAIAREEIREAADYYAAISPDLGIAFKRELRQLMRVVTNMPLAWPSNGTGTRKCLLMRFPYLVIYAPLKDELLARTPFRLESADYINIGHFQNSDTLYIGDRALRAAGMVGSGLMSPRYTS